MKAIIKRELKLALRQPAEWMQPVLFFILVCSLFPLAISADKQMLQNIAPGVIWVSALLATLLSTQRIFKSDFDEGCLEQLFLSPHAFSFIVFIKMLTHWFLIAMPLLLATPLIAYSFNLSSSEIVSLELSLLLGTLSKTSV